MDKLAEYFADLAKKYEPAVAEAAKGAAQVEGYSYLVGGAVSLAISATFACIGYLLLRKIIHDGWDEFTWMPVGLCVAGALIALSIGVWDIVDPWTWAAINHPELWIAKKALHL